MFHVTDKSISIISNCIKRYSAKFRRKNCIEKLIISVSISPIPAAPLDHSFLSSFVPTPTPSLTASLALHSPFSPFLSSLLSSLHSLFSRLFSRPSSHSSSPSSSHPLLLPLLQPLLSPPPSLAQRLSFCPISPLAADGGRRVDGRSDRNERCVERRHGPRVPTHGPAAVDSTRHGSSRLVRAVRLARPTEDPLTGRATAARFASSPARLSNSAVQASDCRARCQPTAAVSQTLYGGCCSTGCDR